MWIETFHRFADRQAFLEACDAAGWPRGPDYEPSPAEGFSLDVIGPGVLPPELVEGVLVPGPVDARWHVNLSRRAGLALPAALAAAEILPELPYRMFAARDPDVVVGAVRARHAAAKAAKADDARLVAEPKRPPRPVKAWQGKAVLKSAGLLEAVEAKVEAAGGRVRDAWHGQETWSRNGELLTEVARSLDLPDDQVDQMFRQAAAIEEPAGGTE